MKFYKKDHTIIALNDDEVKPSGFTSITETEYNRIYGILRQLDDLKFELKKSDYKAIKHSEGLISDEDYEEIKAEREAIRVQIRKLKASI